MSDKLVSGVYAAISTPRHSDGSLDEGSLRKHVGFLARRGIQGIMLNGATGEFCLTTHEELERILAVGVEAAAGLELLCGIGSPGLRGCLDRGALAMAAGVRAVLLPMPYFFPYDQDDLDAFCRAVAKELDVPILLYNLPQFSTGLEPETVRRLVEECPNIAGIKDSSGSLEILRMLTQADLDACRIVGSDDVFAQALEEGLCDGVISGVACALPELLQCLFAERGRPKSAAFQEARLALAGFIDQIRVLPVPWGLKWVAESRGIVPASFAQPVSARRAAQSRALQEWFRVWYASAPISG